jgi:hypothetical protein
MTRFLFWTYFVDLIYDPIFVDINKEELELNLYFFCWYQLSRNAYFLVVKFPGYVEGNEKGTPPILWEVANEDVLDDALFVTFLGH